MQARNFTTNVPKILDLKSSSEQIFFRKFSLGALVLSSLIYQTWWNFRSSIEFVIPGCRKAFKTACDVDEINEQISGRAELEEDEETSLGPWLGHVRTDALPKRRCDSD